MAQHLWRSRPEFRLCEVCREMQAARPNGEWVPSISSICPGDPDDDPSPLLRGGPRLPAGGSRVLEDAA